MIRPNSFKFMQILPNSIQFNEIPTNASKVIQNRQSGQNSFKFNKIRLKSNLNGRSPGTPRNSAEFVPILLNSPELRGADPPEHPETPRNSAELLDEFCWI